MRNTLWCLTLIGLWLCSQVNAGHSRLINGKLVEPGTYKEVVLIRSGQAGCTATVIGPRVIATAAHCARTGATATFTVDGVQYSAIITRSSLYPGKDHDVALGVSSTEIKGVEPTSVVGADVAKEGLGLTLLGYGCTQPGGSDTPDGKLRVGTTAIVGFSEYDMVSRTPGGAALCYGDSGGPAFLVENGKKLLIGINSKGNIQDTNYNTRLDVPESQSFLKGIAQSESVEICGINKNCGDTPPPPPPPTCTLKSSPSTFKLGETTTLSLVSQGEVTEAYIDGKPVGNPTGQAIVRPDKEGTYTSNGKVTGPGGDGTCQTTYIVEKDTPIPTPPTCTLTALPDEIKLGESLTLELSANGEVTEATIDDAPVSFPLGKKLISPPQEGTFSAMGRVKGPGGSGTCSTTYVVSKDPGPDPSIPNFAAVPAYCGENTLSVTQIKSVCLAVIKKDTSLSSLILNKVLLIQYRNGAQEVLPIIFRKDQAQTNPQEVKEELVLYANSTVSAKDYQVLDTRKAVLTKTQSASGEVPLAVEGRSATGQYFMVNKLDPLNITF